MRRFIIWPFLAVLVFVFAWSEGCSSDSDSEQIAKTLQERLNEALPGGIVEADEGIYEGQFTIPEGVMLRAKETGTVILTNDKPGFTVKMVPYHNPPTALEGVHVHSSGSLGILTAGDGLVRIEQVTVFCNKGIGLAADGLTGLVVDQSTFTGESSSTNDLRYPIDPKNYPAIGFVISKVKELLLDEVSVNGFTGIASILQDTQGQWKTGGVVDNIGIGILVDGGAIDLENLTVERTTNCEHISCAIENQVYGIAAINSAHLTTTSVTTRENDGIGLFHHRATGHHTGLQASNNKHAGVWLQYIDGNLNEPGISIGGAANVIRANGGGAVVILESGGIILANAELAKTSLITIPNTEDCELCNNTIGDGVHIVNLKDDLSFRNLLISDNTRVGVLLSGNEAQASVGMQNVQITGEGNYGLIAQDGFDREEYANNQEEVDIDDNLAENDITFTGGLDVAVPIAIPSVGEIADRGLVGDEGIVDDEGRLGSGSLVGKNGSLGTVEQDD